MRANRIVSGLALLGLVMLASFWFRFQVQSAKMRAQIIGMSRTQVQSFLGPPLKSRVDEQGERWHYSSLRFPDMEVLFSTNGIAVAVAEK